MYYLNVESKGIISFTWFDTLDEVIPAWKQEIRFGKYSRVFIECNGAVVLEWNTKVGLVLE